MRFPSSEKTLLIVLMAAMYLMSRYHHSSPDPVCETVSAAQFSSERAYNHILEMASEPHPAGSPQAAKVRGYLENQIRLIGLEPEIQETVVYRPPSTFATVQNVLARIEGTSGANDAIALMAHYDSVVFGPGAADDTSGTAALLESMRALKNGPPLFNDIIFIFTDGEEGRALGGTGLRGAYAFAEQHLWAKDVRVVINFDARGVRGQSYMYQTSGKNKWLIEQLAASGCSAAATSTGYEVYSRMPVGSDLTAFIEKDIPGYDCAFIHGLEKYHTQLDSPENLSLSSLQHHGEYAFTLARHLANQPLADSKNVQNNLVYFDFPIVGMVYYSENMALFFMALSVALYAVILWLGVHRKQIRITAYLTAAGIYIALFFLFCLAGAVFMIIGYKTRGIYILYSSDELTLGLLLVVAGISIYFFNRLVARLGVYNVLFGFLLPWVIISALLPFLMPGASYIFTWPLIFAVISIASFFLNRKGSNLLGLGSTTLLGIAAFPTILFTIGTLQGFYAALMFIFVSLHIAVLLFAFAMLMPQIYVLTAAIPKRTAATLILLGMLSIFAAIFWRGFSPAQPKFNSITYGLNSDTGTAVYMSCDAEVDPWTEQFLGKTPQRLPITDFIPYAQNAYLQAPAPVVEAAPPTLEVLDDVNSDDTRTLHLRIDSPRNAEVVEVYALAGTKVKAATVNGIPMTLSEGPWRLSYSIYRGGGIDVVLQLEDNL